MIFIPNAVDYGAPEYLVRGPAAVELVTRGIIRVSHYSIGRNLAGELERRIAVHNLWDKEEFLSSFAVWQSVRREIEAGLLNETAALVRLMAH